VQFKWAVPPFLVISHWVNGLTFKLSRYWNDASKEHLESRWTKNIRTYSSHSRGSWAPNIISDLTGLKNIRKTSRVWKSHTGPTITTFNASWMWGNKWILIFDF
jgi:hypothetical protein